MIRSFEAYSVLWGDTTLRDDGRRLHADRAVAQRLLRGLWVRERDSGVVVVRLDTRHALREEEARVDVLLQKDDEDLY